MGNWPLMGPLEGCYLHPHFWPMGKWPLRGPILGGCNFWTPHFGPIRGHLPIFEFWVPQGQWPTPTPTDTQPIAREPTHLGVDLNWTRFLPSPSPTQGATLGSTLRRHNLCLAAPHTARELPIPHTGGQHGRSLTSNVTPTQYLHHHPYAMLDQTCPFTTGKCLNCME